jgi:hypothetical protein
MDVLCAAGNTLNSDRMHNRLKKANESDGGEADVSEGNGRSASEQCEFGVSGSDSEDDTVAPVLERMTPSNNMVTTETKSDPTVASPHISSHSERLVQAENLFCSHLSFKRSKKMELWGLLVLGRQLPHH